MAQVKFMDDIVAEYRRLFDTPILTHYTANEMASNYYFLDKDGNTQDENGNYYYVDQFTLQEYFDYESEDNGLCNSYDNEPLEEKAYALQELAYVTTGGQL